MNNLIWYALVVVIIIAFLYFIILGWCHKRKLKKLQEDYNEKENQGDKSSGIVPREIREGFTSRRDNRVETTEPTLTSTSPDVQRDGKFEGREVLSAISSGSAPENRKQSRTAKRAKRLKGIFNRRR